MSVTWAWGARRQTSSAALPPVKPPPTITTDKALSTSRWIDPNVGASQRSGVGRGKPRDDTSTLLRRKGRLASACGAAHVSGNSRRADRVYANPKRTAFDGEDLSQSSQSRF